MSVRFPIGALLVVWSGLTLAQSAAVIEEIMVTAQRVEEDLQKVPIAASAFSDTMIRDRQIVGLEDLQFHVPNINYSEQAFNRGRYQIRGVGRQVDVDTGEDGVSVHLDGIPIPAESRVELLDVERLEVSRGPQGTLYGRNSTGGVVNMITRKPSTEGIEGHIGLEYGDYDHRRLAGAFNLPVADNLAVRIAAMGLKRDGFTKNLAAGQVQGVDEDMDGRDLWSARASVKWWITESLTATLTYHHFDEDDDRMIRHAQVCKQNTLPTIGCVPNEFAFETPHPQSAAFYPTFLQQGIGARSAGARDASTGLQFDFPRPALDFRRQHTDFQPIYQREEDYVAAVFEWSGERYAATLSAAYFDAQSLQMQDDVMDVGFTFPSTPLVPDGRWPTSADSGGFGTLRTSDQCNVNEGTYGVLGGCVWPADEARHFRYESMARETEQVSVEAKLHSQFDGPLNFLVGANYLWRHRGVDSFRFDNIADQFGRTGFPFPTGGTFLLSWPFNYHQEHNDFDSYSGFGELYWQATEDIRLTLGARYNRDETYIADAFTGASVNARFPPTATQPEWIRANFGTWYHGGAPQPGDTDLTDFYGATDAILAAPPFSEERLRAFQQVPLVFGINEARLLEGTSPRRNWDGVTARAGITWTPTAQAMSYAFYSRGYKPGGFQWGSGGAGEPIDKETVHSIELGAKTRLLNDSMRVNVALFWSDYQNLQLDTNSIITNATITENFDAESWGIELEVEWRPSILPNLQLSLAYSWLHSQVDEQLAFDSFDPLQGNADYVLLSDSGPFGQGGLFVAPRADVLPWVNPAIAFGLANPAPDTVYPDGIPAIFSRALLDAVGVETSRGFSANVKGNEIPMAPEHTLGVGLAYSWYLGAGTVHARWDYYWQSRSFATVFNNPGSRVPSWEQHNVSLTFEAASGRWLVQGWGRNLTDEVNINNGTWQTGAAGGARVYAVNDPRLFGVTVQVSVGSN